MVCAQLSEITFSKWLMITKIYQYDNIGDLVNNPNILIDQIKSEQANTIFQVEADKTNFDEIKLRFFNCNNPTDYLPNQEKHGILNNFYEKLEGSFSQILHTYFEKLTAFYIMDAAQNLRAPESVVIKDDDSRLKKYPSRNRKR